MNVTSRPLPPLALTLKYRLFDFNDMTDEFVIPGAVVNDRTLSDESPHVHRFPYTRHNLDGDARWRFGPMAAADGRRRLGAVGPERPRARSSGATSTSPRRRST